MNDERKTMCVEQLIIHHWSYTCGESRNWMCMCVSVHLDPSQCITPILTESKKMSSDLTKVHHISPNLIVSQYLSDALQIFSNITKNHCIYVG